MNKNRKQQARPAPRNDIDPPQQRNGMQDALPVAQYAPQQARRVQRPQQNVPVVAAPRPIRQRNPPDWYQAKPKSSSSKNQRPGPSNQVFQSRNGHTGEDQENMEVEEDVDQRVPIKKNKRGTKRQRETSVDVDTDGIGNRDTVANTETTPGSSQAAIEGEAPKNKAARIKQEHFDHQMRKQQESQQKMKEQMNQQPVKKMKEQEEQQKNREQDEKLIEHRLKVREQNNEQLRQQKKEEVENMRKQLEQQREKQRKNEERNENDRGGVDQQQDFVPVQDIGNESIGNISPVPHSNEELAIAVKDDDLVIETISKEEQETALKKAKKFIDDEMEKTLASNESNEAKRVSSALRQVAKVLNQKAYLSSPLSAYDDANRIFTANMSKCEHRVDEESALYSICDQFLNIMTSAFCCKRFLVATSVDQQCKGHETTCWIKNGHRCYKRGDDYYCMKWFEESNSQTSKMKKVIYRHFQPEKYETCTTCKTVWHPKCRLTRLLKDEDSLPCRNHNDMLHIKHFSRQFKETPLQKALSENYHKNRGTLPELQFVHSICKTVTAGKELEKVKVKPEDYTHEVNQIFVTVMIKNVETLIFALNTQEYRSGPKKGWVVIEYLDSLSILTKDRSAIYKRIIRSYLKYARDSGFKIAHLWSCAPDNGVDYIFSGHPKSQRFLRKDRLDEWYLSIFQECDGEFGKVDVGYAKKYFDEVLKKTTVEDMCNSLVLANGFWAKEIEKIIEKMKENKDDSFEYFKQKIEKVKDASKNFLFYVKLREGGQNEMEILLETTKPQEDDLFSNDITGDRDEFLNKQCFYDIEFTDLRQAQFATRQILLEVFVARGGVENLPRGAPKPLSVFKRGSNQSKWTHQ